MFIQVRILSLSSPRFLQNYHIRFLSQTAKQEICWSEREIFRTRNGDVFQSKMKEPQKFTKLNCPLNQTTRTSQASPLERSATLITSRDAIHPQYAKCLHPPTNQPTNQGNSPSPQQISTCTQHGTQLHRLFTHFFDALRPWYRWLY